MKEKIAVYEALREHILHKEDQIVSETIYMYVTYFAILAVGSIWSDWVSLASFVVLIVFQSMINGDQWSVCKASLYIKVFFEMQYDDIHWESLHSYPFYSSVYGETIRKTIGWYICKCGATFLSAFSFMSILFSVLHNSDYQIYTIPPYSTARIVLAFILFLITIFVNKQYFSLRESNQSKDKLEQAIKSFYREIYGTQLPPN